MSQKKFNQALTDIFTRQKTKGKIHAKLGTPAGELYYYDLSGSLVRDVVWVTLSDSTTRVVRNKRVLNQYGLSVILEYAADGVLEVSEEDFAVSTPFGGGRSFNLPNHAWAHGIFGPDTLYVNGLQLTPLQPHPNNPPDMNLVVEPYFYTFNYTSYYFTGNSINLSLSHAESGGGTQTFVVVALNPVTADLAIFRGFGASPFPPSTVTLPFSGTDVAQVNVGSCIPICAVRLYAGQTAINWHDIFMDLRNSAGTHNSLGGSLQTAVIYSDDTLCYNDELVWIGD